MEERTSLSIIERALANAACQLFDAVGVPKHLRHYMMAYFLMKQGIKYQVNVYMDELESREYSINSKLGEGDYEDVVMEELREAQQIYECSRDVFESMIEELDRVFIQHFGNAIGEAQILETFDKIAQNN